jgi:hypothetical protein
MIRKSGIHFCGKIMLQSTIWRMFRLEHALAMKKLRHGLQPPSKQQEQGLQGNGF